MIYELDVTLTDYMLTIETAVFAFLLARAGSTRGSFRGWMSILFASISVGSAAGGTVHGFFPDPSSAGLAILWSATLIALGAAAFAAWAAGARLILREAPARRLTAVALTAFVLYVLFILFVSRSFRVAVANYLPASLFLTTAIGIHYHRTRRDASLIGLAGMLLTYVATLLQSLGVGLHPYYFNHNALYHVIQGVALLLLFFFARAEGAQPRAEAVSREQSRPLPPGADR